MATFEQCDKSVENMAGQLLHRYESHKPLLIADAKIDYVFAYGARNDEGELTGDALKKNGVKALGIARIVPLKERALGRGDAEVSLDGDWWKNTNDEERQAVLDHELHHFAVKVDNGNNIKTDDLGRPMLRMRKHDVDVGWFKVIAERHGVSSVEQIQARQIMDAYGQYFWPDIADAVKGQGRFANLETDREHTKMTITAGGKSVEVTSEQLAYAAKNPGKVIAAAANKTTKD